MNDPKDIYKKFSPNARKILITSQKIAQGMDTALGSEHILLALAVTTNTLANSILKEHMVSMDQIRLVISLRYARDKATSGMNSEAREILEEAANIAKDYGHSQIDSEHIVMALVTKEDSVACKIIKQIGIDPLDIKDQIEDFFNNLKDIEENPNLLPPKLPPSFNAFFEPFSQDSPPAEMGMPGFGKPKKPENYFIDMTNLAKDKQLDPVIGREKELQRLIQILCRRTKNNPVLVGEPGVGKTAIVESLAQQIIAGTVPTNLKNKKLAMLDLPSIVAGTMYRGQFEERIKSIIDDLVKKGDTILFIDELHTIVGAGSAEGSLDLANILKPALSKGKLRIIGATTFDEYRKFIEKDPALERRLQKIVVDEPSQNEAVEILKGIRYNYETHHGVKITDDAVTAAVELSNRYIMDRNLPDKAIDLIDEASSARQIKNDTIIDKDSLNIAKQLQLIREQKENEAKNENFAKAAELRQTELQLEEKLKLSKQNNSKNHNEIDREDIAKVLSLWTNVPVESLKQEDKNKYLKLSSTLKRSIIGQDQAISLITDAIKRSKTGITDPNRPIGSFVFLGPTGVGKTELAKVLAESLFDSKEAIIKIDMSEFMEKHNVSRLVGAPPGYVGYDEAGKLTEQVRQKPYSVILFDEIEKAHPEVFNLLLQILEDGELTDAKGRKVNFRNTIVILTSNIGVQKLNAQQAIGFTTNKKTVGDDYDKMKSDIIKDLKEHFRPELLNRLDKIVVFKPLGQKEIEAIAKLQLDNLVLRVKKEGIELKLDQKVVKYVSKHGFEPNYGARPIRRAISDLIEDPLSEMILTNKLTQNQKIKITVLKDKICFN